MATPLPDPAEMMLSKSIDVALSQLEAQSARLDALDIKAFALLGFDAAIAAALISAKDNLGRHWWTAMIGIGISVLLGVQAAAEQDTGVNLGPDTEELYQNATTGTTVVAYLEDLLKRLQGSLTANSTTEDQKRHTLALGAGVLFLTSVYAAFAFTLWRG